MMLIVDAYNVAYKGYYAMKHQLQGAEPYEAALYGFLRQLMNQWRLRGSVTSNLYVVFDHGRCQRRLGVYPEYKGNRTNRDEKLQAEIGRAVDTIIELSSVWPWFSLRAENTEADDLIASLRLSYYQTPAAIMSSDKDMLQLCLLNDTHVILSADEVISSQRWEGKKVDPTGEGPINRENWLLYRLLVGDSSDNIKGVPGMGEKRAAALCRYPERISLKRLVDDEEYRASVFAATGLEGQRAAKRRLGESREILERNVELMTLMDPAMLTPITNDLFIGPRMPDWASARSYVQQYLEYWRFASILKDIHYLDDMATRVWR